MAMTFKSTQAKHRAIVDEIRYHFFEIGISLSPEIISHHLDLAEQSCLKRLAFAAKEEQLAPVEEASQRLMTYLIDLEKACKHSQKDSVFWAWDRLKDELTESYANEAMASAYRSLWDKALRRQAKQFSSLWQWVLVTLPHSQQVAFFEQWGSHQGHPYHPNTKAKMGLSRREVLKYSPEYQATIDIHWLAIAKTHAKTQSNTTDYATMLSKAFPELMAKWRYQLEERQLSPDDYYPIPVHPWQWHNTITQVFSHLIDAGIIQGPLCGQSVSPSMAFRTMIPDNPHGLHIKLATAIHTTSAMRTVSPASVNNGPRVSRLLTTLLERESYYDGSIDILADTGGLHVTDPSAPGGDNAKQLACLFRENPNSKLMPQQTAIPLACLFTESPISHRPLLVEIIDSSGIDPKAYFDEYCQMLLPSQLSLYLKYGIGLEAHQQNTLIVFEHHRPIKHLNRDLGGIRIDCQHLLTQGLSVELEPGSLIRAEHFEDVRLKFIHANFQSNLSYWVETLCQNYSLAQADLWDIVKRHIDDVFDSLSGSLPNNFLDQEKQQLFSAPWKRKSLLRMRLEHCQGNYLYKHIQNPMSCNDRNN